MTLARALRDREGLGVVFALNGTDEAAAVVRQAGFAAVLLPQGNVGTGLARLMDEKKPDMLIADARDALSPAAFAREAAKVAVAAVIDEGSERRRFATHAYYPPAPQVKDLSWKGTGTLVRAGWEWALLGFDPAAMSLPEKARDAKPLIIVSMGGSDPLDLTELAASALAKITTPFRARFVIGPGFRNAAALARSTPRIAAQFLKSSKASPTFPGNLPRPILG